MTADTPRSAGRIAHVALVAGPESLRNLGPVVRHMIVGLLDEPRPVTLVCPDTAELGSLPAPPMRVIRFRRPRLRLFLPKLAARLAAALDEAGVRLLHALDADALPLTRQLAAAGGRRFLTGVYSLKHDPGLHDDRCRAVLAGSEPIRRMLLSGHVAAPERVHLLRPGVYPARSATCFADPRHDVALVAAGELRRLAPWSAVLEAFAQLRRRGAAGPAERQDGFVFFVIGNGRAESPLRRHAELLGLMPDLTFVDQQSPEALTDILRAADVFIAPDPSDRVDMELLAAMASGTPAVAAGSGAADFITDQTALIYPRADAAELSARILWLLNDRAAARGLAERALAYLRQNHSPTRMVEQLAGLYDAIAAENP